MNKTVLILDSSQIDTFLTCPTQWYYQYVRKLQPVAARENVPMSMGTYGHKLLEIIYKAKAAGHRNPIEEAFAYDIDKETCRCSHGREKHSQDFMKSACLSMGCPCTEFIPTPFPLSAADREFTRQRVLEYTFVEGSGIPELIPKSSDHVEVGFSHKLYEDDTRLYILEGRIDLLGQIANNCPDGWADHKFQARERDLYLKSIQFRNYSLVTNLSIGVVNYIRFARKIEKGKTFKRDVISFSRSEMEAWQRNLIDIYAKVEAAVKCDSWYDSRDALRVRAACAGKFGYPCDYCNLCEEFYNPGLIKINEQQNYKQREEWRPW